MNTILGTDSYKLSHWLQYPPRTECVHSYFEARGGIFPEVLFFGLQYLLRTALLPVTMEHIEEAAGLVRSHMGSDAVFNRSGWEHIVRAHQGRLPLHVRAIPEGVRVPVGTALMTVENTDPEVPWLTNYLETRLSQVWYPTTVATVSYACKQIILRYLQRTGTPESIGFKLHDFGYRGSTSHESAGIGGLAHLAVGFRGSDTLAAVIYGRDYYGCDMAAFSIPAAEHSTITSWGREHEIDAYANMLRAYPDGPVAVVSDSYDIYEACDSLWGQLLHDEVVRRQGTLVIRPDSGDPPTVVHHCLDILGRRFGTTVNSKGYRVLDSHVRLIQGDGVDPVIIDKVLAVLELNGWSADNVAFGMGGALLQKVNRDTCQFAFKCSSITVDGEQRDVWKSPVGDPSKASKRGRLSTFVDDFGHPFTAAIGDDVDIPYNELMRTVWLNGRQIIDESLETIRQRVGEVL